MAKRNLRQNCIDCGKSIWKRGRCKPCHFETMVIHPDRIFWGNVNKTKTCWIWNGGKEYFGYGVFNIRIKKGIHKGVKAHRYSWTIHKGEIPKGKFVLHKCDNPACVNPKHLFIGTLQDNNLDRDKKLRFHRKLSKKQVQKIRSSTEKQIVLAKRFSIGQDQISRIINHKRWK